MHFIRELCDDRVTSIDPISTVMYQMCKFNVESLFDFLVPCPIVRIRYQYCNVHSLELLGKDKTNVFCI